MQCQICKKEGAQFTGHQMSYPDPSDCNNTSENLPFGCAWLCDDHLGSALDAFLCPPEIGVEDEIVSRGIVSLLKSLGYDIDAINRISIQSDYVRVEWEAYRTWAKISRSNGALLNCSDSFDWENKFNQPIELTCEECGGLAERSSYCGGIVCNSCGHHNGYVRCFCGWSLSGRNGRTELEELGEQIEEDF